MEATPSLNQVVQPVEIGDDVEDNMTNMLNEDADGYFSNPSSRPSSPGRDEIATLSSPPSRALVLHVPAIVQDTPLSQNESEVETHPSLTEEQRHFDLPSE